MSSSSWGISSDSNPYLSYFCQWPLPWQCKWSGLENLGPFAQDLELVEGMGAAFCDHIILHLSVLPTCRACMHGYMFFFQTGYVFYLLSIYLNSNKNNSIICYLTPQTKKIIHQENFVLFYGGFLYLWHYYLFFPSVWHEYRTSLLSQYRCQLDWMKNDVLLIILE